MTGKMPIKTLFSKSVPRISKERLTIILNTLILIGRLFLPVIARVQWRLINLMRKHFNDPDLQKRLVAAYLIGYSVTKDDLKKYPWMKLAQGENDTGVIITYNTEGADAGPSPVLLPGAGAINPLNWRTDSTPGDRDANLGA